MTNHECPACGFGTFPLSFTLQAVESDNPEVRAWLADAVTKMSVAIRQCPSCHAVSVYEPSIPGAGAMEKREREDQALERLREILKPGQWRDAEAQHIEADDLLCEILTAEGYGRLVAAFQEMEKWYA